jgi:hypothetical protein
MPDGITQLPSCLTSFVLTFNLILLKLFVRSGKFFCIFIKIFCIDHHVVYKYSFTSSFPIHMPLIYFLNVLLLA